METIPRNKLYLLHRFPMTPSFGVENTTGFMPVSSKPYSLPNGMHERAYHYVPPYTARGDRFDKTVCIGGMIEQDKDWRAERRIPYRMGQHINLARGRKHRSNVGPMENSRLGYLKSASFFYIFVLREWVIFSKIYAFPSDVLFSWNRTIALNLLSRNYYFPPPSQESKSVSASAAIHGSLLFRQEDLWDKYSGNDR